MATGPAHDLSATYGPIHRQMHWDSARSQRRETLASDVRMTMLVEFCPVTAAVLCICVR